MRVIYRGPAHVIVSASKRFRDMWPEAIGVPSREAFPQECYREAQRVMDWVYRTGVPRTIPVQDRDGRDGHLLFEPITDPQTGRPVGLASLWVPVRASTRGSPPAPRGQKGLTPQRA